MVSLLSRGYLVAVRLARHATWESVEKRRETKREKNEKEVRNTRCNERREYSIGKKRKRWEERKSRKEVEKRIGKGGREESKRENEREGIIEGMWVKIPLKGQKGWIARLAIAALALFFFVPRQPQIPCDYPFASSANYRSVFLVTNTMKTWLNVHVLDKAPCAFIPLEKKLKQHQQSRPVVARYLRPKWTSSSFSLLRLVLF